MTRTLILPGFRGSFGDHWQAHWLRDDPRAVLVEQDDWERPDLDLWNARLQEVLATTDKALLVAHSLGCLLAARIASSPLAGRVKGAFLVAPCDPALTEKLHPGAIRFGALPEKRLSFPSMLVASRSDPYMQFNEARRLAAAWGSSLVDLGPQGHINVKSGFGRWPMGYRLASLLSRERGRSKSAVGAPQPTSHGAEGPSFRSPLT
ncbi:hypothetical protein AU381_22030 [Sinorhizobium glycinis]|uniref:Esterase n=2 Tax=Sinorhizobium glycinis TaxID=1472378 RepID=A0A178XTU2_9HYPH|nr:hypothetical protein AU381_22030 [Sinorhizobium glycinis]